MKLKHHLICLAFIVICIECEAQQRPQQPVKRPNILFIMADDHAYQAISAYGSKLIQTPNIDRIAREGALMKSAYVTNSVCSPSRAVILTGKYSHINGMKDNGTYFNGAQQTLPKIFKQYGYQTAIVGYLPPLPDLITGIFCPIREITIILNLLKWVRIPVTAAM